jgi:L-asparaginase
MPDAIEKPRICLIYTGGTIAMVADEAGVVRPPKDPGEFLNIEPAIHEHATVDMVVLANKDSANMTPGDWRAIAEAVYVRRDGGYTGFVVAHGTDTMHFSASAVAFALGPDLPFPVVFTGSQSIPRVRHGDARTNLLRSVLVAKSEIAEVCICFGDFVFRGCRAQKKDERKFDAFESPAYPELAYIADDIVLKPALARLRPKTARRMVFRPHFAAGVIEVTLIPGLEPELVMPCLESNLCNGLILQSFGAGNVPHEGDCSFLPLIRRAVARNTPVILTSQFPAGGTNKSRYATAADAIREGAIPTGSMTNAAAVTKFRWVLAEVLREIADGTLRASDKLVAVAARMNADYIGETDRPPA